MAEYTDDENEAVEEGELRPYHVSIMERWQRLYHNVMATSEDDAVNRVMEAEGRGDADELWPGAELEYLETDGDDEHLAFEAT